MITRKIEILGDEGCEYQCVLNALDTERGREIEKELLGWLVSLYRVHVVWHDGSDFEYDGLRYLKDNIGYYEMPWLYLHTKGACNKPYWSRLIRDMWRMEFGDKVKASMYLCAASRNEGAGVVACPVLDHRRIPLYNGFFVNKEAMAVAEIEKNEDRYTFEKMWQRKPEVEFKVMKYFGTLPEIHRFLRVEYDS